MNDQQRILVLQAQLNAALAEKAQLDLESATLQKTTALAENEALKQAAAKLAVKSASVLRYNAMIRRRADALARKGLQYEAIVLLKTIGE